MHLKFIMISLQENLLYVNIYKMNIYMYTYIVYRTLSKRTSETIFRLLDIVSYLRQIVEKIHNSH